MHRPVLLRGPALSDWGWRDITDKWTKYKHRSAVERQYVWKLHAEKDLGVSLAVSTMDLEKSYTDPEKTKDDANGLIAKDAPPLLHGVH